MILPLVAATFSGFMVVFLKAIQQQNITGGHYAASFVTSFLIAAAEGGVIASIATQGFYTAIFVGTGGGLGVMLAIWSHGRIMQALKRKWG